jgi:T5orf172 domain
MSVETLPSGNYRVAWHEGAKKRGCTFPTKAAADRFDAKVKRAKVRARARAALETVEPAWPEAIYFARAASGPIKIGKTTQPEIRLAGLRNGSAEHIYGERVVWAPAGLERVLHRLLARHRLHGEWFAPEPLVLETLALPDDALRALAQLPLKFVETVVR